MASVNTFIGHLARKLEAGGSETTIYLDRITTRTGETITTSQFAALGRGILTINPDGDGETSYPEWASFTAVDSSAVAVTGAIRGLSALGNSVVTANKRFHPVGTPVVISFGVHNFQDILDKLDDDIAATTVGTANAVTGIAGETIATAPALVYLKNDGKWWLTDADTSATVNEVQLGIALSAVAADASITSGVIRSGRVSGFTGLVAGTTYYASNTAGEISSSAGTNAKRVGVTKSSTELYFDPEYYELPSGNEKEFLSNVAENNILAFGGDGSDGALNVTSGTTTLDLSTKTVYNYTSITIASGATLTFSGGEAGQIVPVIKCQGNFVNEGTVDLAGKGASGGAGGAGRDGWSVGLAGDGEDGTGVGIFVDATTPDPGNLGTGAEVTSTTANASPGTPGALSAKNATYFTILPFNGTGGGGGGGGAIGNTGNTAGDGGAGGAGGLGILLQIGGSFNNTGTITANGQDGTVGQNSVGNGSSSTEVGAGGGGGGGAAGSLVILYNNSLIASGTLTATGGTGGTGGSQTNTGGGGGTLYDGAGGGAGGGGASFFADGLAGGATSSGNGGNGGDGADGIVYLSKYYS